MNKEQIKERTLRQLAGYYNNNPNGGSSRWLVSPDTVALWLSNAIDTILAERDGEWKNHIEKKLKPIEEFRVKNDDSIIVKFTEEEYDALLTPNMVE